MILMGLGDYSVYLDCSACDPGDDQCFADCGKPGTNTSSSTPSGSSSDPWWATLTKALSSGAAAGVTSSLVNQPKAPVAPPPTPWYLTPFGILAILGVVGGGAYFLAKK